MATFIIVLIVASLLGSILWIRPSNKERQQMQLRLLARKKQLSVQFTHIDLPDKWDKSKTKTKVTAYHKFRAKKQASLTESVNLYPYEVWKHDEVANGWYASRPLSSNQPLALSDMAITILQNSHHLFTAIKIEFDCVSLYWNETGEESDIDDINALLQELEKMAF